MWRAHVSDTTCAPVVGSRLQQQEGIHAACWGMCVDVCRLQLVGMKDVFDAAALTCPASACIHAIEAEPSCSLRPAPAVKSELRLSCMFNPQAYTSCTSALQCMCMCSWGCITAAASHCPCACLCRLPQHVHTTPLSVCVLSCCLQRWPPTQQVLVWLAQGAAPGRPNCARTAATCSASSRQVVPPVLP